MWRLWRNNFHAALCKDQTGVISICVITIAILNDDHTGISIKFVSKLFILFILFYSSPASSFYTLFKKEKKLKKHKTTRKIIKTIKNTVNTLEDRV